MDPAGRPEPQRRLAPNARRLWRIEGAAAAAAALVAAGVLAAMADRGWITAAAWSAALLFGVCAVLVVPELRWRRWRWDVGDHEVEIRHGALTVTHTLVPLRRVQHVDTRQGLLERALDLATVVFHTAAGETKIPALSAGEAAQVRDRIAALTRTADEL